MKVRVALIGNPNVGKSVIFNSLTGMKQHTGNWPGKTVEKKEGYFKHHGVEFEIVDLPGVYSLSAVSDDEKVARSYIVDHRPDIVVDIVNASQLERNLYLTLLLIELQVNLVVAMNMYDIVKSRGDQIDLEGLSKHLGARVVATTATRKEGIEQLKDAILAAVPQHYLDSSKDEDDVPLHTTGDVDSGDHLHYHPKFHHHGEFERLEPPAIMYSLGIESNLKKLVMILQEDKTLIDRFPPRWLALKVLERDPEILTLFEDSPIKDRLLEVTL
ncbi:MAG: 50S ribosome-binding GTPase [Candidatus Thorarchaeota archaeon]|nr:50S ribosome-binding GTPase [Candidatus Thorarchaeota archaeon]